MCQIKQISHLKSFDKTIKQPIKSFDMEFWKLDSFSQFYNVCKYQKLIADLKALQVAINIFVKNKSHPWTIEKFVLRKLNLINKYKSEHTSTWRRDFDYHKALMTEKYTRDHLWKWENLINTWFMVEALS